MLDTRRAPLEGLGGVHAGRLLAASSQAVEALLGHWISRPEAGLAHGVACLSPPFISGTGTSTPAAFATALSTVLYHYRSTTATLLPHHHATLLSSSPPQRSRSPSPSSDGLAISFAGYKSRPDPDSSFPTLHDIPVAFGLLRNGMSPEPIKPASGRRTVCDHCRRRRKSTLPHQLACARDAVLSWPILAHVTTEPDYRQLPADLYLHEHRHTM
ncbi:hypothetical protein BGZ57DRAFT_186008 [Hyaloscypha finlandica]|nr:hypothetical protein BGZ57DRAFT_186008 [Hyaloscypha finlandica]